MAGKRRDADLSIDEMVRRYKAGETCVDIGAAAGLSTSAVASRLKQQGIKLRPGGKGPGSGRIDLPVAEIARRYRAGETLDMIAAMTGLNPSTVKYRLRRAGVALRRTGKAPGQGRLDLPVAEIIRRYRAGQSTHAIGRALGVSADTIHGRVVEAGVARRPPGTRGVKAAGKRPKPAGRKGT
jgi:DNA-binding CsgD family transcriptional regulator